MQNIETIIIFNLVHWVYHNTFSNLIKDYAIEPGLLSYRNIEKAYFTGIEIISKWAINSKLSSSFTFNYVKNEDENKEQTQTQSHYQSEAGYHTPLEIKNFYML